MSKVKEQEMGYGAESSFSEYPSENDIATRSYEIWPGRGSQENSAEEDWLQAERGTADKASRKKREQLADCSRGPLASEFREWPPINQPPSGGSFGH